MEDQRCRLSTSDLRTGDHLKHPIIPARLLCRDARHDDMRWTHRM